MALSGAMEGYSRLSAPVAEGAPEDLVVMVDTSTAHAMCR